MDKKIGSDIQDSTDGENKDSNVIYADFLLSDNPNVLIEQTSIDQDVKDVIIVGTYNDNEIFIRLSPMKISMAVFLLEKAKMDILNGAADVEYNNEPEPD